MIEIVEFDFEKITRRRVEKLKTIKQKNQLFTFELNDLIMKKKILNFIIDVSTIFRVAKKKKFNDNFFRDKLIDFDIFIYENNIYIEIKNRNDDVKD